MQQILELCHQYFFTSFYWCQWRGSPQHLKRHRVAMHYIEAYGSWKTRHSLRWCCGTSNHFQDFSPIFVSKRGYNSCNKRWLCYEQCFSFSLLMSIFFSYTFCFIHFCFFCWYLTVAQYHQVKYWCDRPIGYIFSCLPRISHSQLSSCLILKPEQILWTSPTLCSVIHVDKVLRDTYKNHLV